MDKNVIVASDDTRVMTGLDWLNVSIVVSEKYLAGQHPKSYLESKADYYSRISRTLNWTCTGKEPLKSSVDSAFGGTAGAIAESIAIELGYDLDEIEKAEGGEGITQLGYKYRLGLEKGFNIAFGDSYHNGILVQLTGEALGSVRSQELPEDVIWDKIHTAAKCFTNTYLPWGRLIVRATRADVALDFVNYGFSVQELHERYIKNEARSLLTRLKESGEQRIRSGVDFNGNSGETNTLYIGSKKSRKTFIRIYNKRVEQAANLEAWLKKFDLFEIRDWVRSEVQLMKGDADEFMKEYVKASDKFQILLREQKNQIRIWDTSSFDGEGVEGNTIAEQIQNLKNLKRIPYADVLEMTGCKLSDFTQAVENLVNVGGVTPLASIDDKLLGSKVEQFFSNSGAARLLYEIGMTFEMGASEFEHFVRNDFADSLLTAFDTYAKHKAAKSSGYIERNKERNQKAGLPLFGIAPSEASSSHSDDRGE